MRARKTTGSSKRQQRRRFVRPLLCETLESRWLLDNSPLGLDPDRFEPNDALPAAAPIGLAPGVHLSQLSIHETTDTDWFSFRMLRPDTVNFAVAARTPDVALSLVVTDEAEFPLATGTVDLSGVTPAKAALSPGIEKNEYTIGSGSNRTPLRPPRIQEPTYCPMPIYGQTKSLSLKLQSSFRQDEYRACTF